MNKFYKILFLIPLIVVGCKGSDLSNKKFSQVFDKLNMNIYSNEGENEKLVPHPHDEVAFGLLILKLEPISSSL